MVQINFNARQFDPSTGSQDVFETGEYGFMIVSSEVKPTKAGGTMLVMDAKCGDEGQMGKKITIRLNIQNSNPTAVEIAHRDLSAICHVVGVLDVSDTDQLHGRPFRMRLEKTPRDDKPELFNNDIKAYLDAQGNTPVAGQSAAASGGVAPAAPSAPVAPAPPVAAATAPAPVAPVAPVAEAPAAPAVAEAAAPVAPPAITPPAPVAPPAAAPVAPVAAGATPPWQR